MTEIPTGTPAEAISNRPTDLYAESFCESCETSAAIEECDIERDTDWFGDSCNCGETEVLARVCPWPRDGMVLDEDGKWRFPEELAERPEREGGRPTMNPFRNPYMDSYSYAYSDSYRPSAGAPRGRRRAKEWRGFKYSALLDIDSKGYPNEKIRNDHSSVPYTQWTISPPANRGFSLASSSGRRAGKQKPVQTQTNGTAVRNSERKIANCVRCSRIRSIWRGAGGECAECFAETKEMGE